MDTKKHWRSSAHKLTYNVQITGRRLIDLHHYKYIDSKQMAITLQSTTNPWHKHAASPMRRCKTDWLYTKHTFEKVLKIISIDIYDLTPSSPLFFNINIPQCIHCIYTGTVLLYMLIGTVVSSKVSGIGLYLATPSFLSSNLMMANDTNTAVKIMSPVIT